MSFKLQSRIPQLQGEMRRRAGQLVRKTAFGIEAHAKASMGEQKHGRIYKRGKKKHQASASGEAPAIDEGALVNSIQTEMTGEMSAVIGSNMEYAPHLELGTIHIAPRPFLGPAFEAAKDEFEAGLKELLK
jgi:HK97 gp10 family phage protein